MATTMRYRVKGGMGSASMPCWRGPRGTVMFTIVRKFRLTRGSAGEVTRRVRESFVPLLRDLPGFREYYLLEGGPDVLISIRVFESADEALASNETAASWIRENVLEFVKGMPEVMAGNVLVADRR
jgi:antibiotic biosynthesis monooxygenase